MVIGEKMAKEAMVSPIEPRQYQTGWDESGSRPVPVWAEGYRVAQVVPVGETFPMTEPIFWAECPDEVEQDQYVYDPNDKQFHLAILPPLPSMTTQPTTQGLQTL